MQLNKSGFVGEIWPVHPEKNKFLGLPCFKDTAGLPGIPDAAFLGVNRNLSVSIIRELSDLGAGGAVCFASGFAEGGTTDLQNNLIAAAGEMPFLGPNCYGFLNYLDNALLWPDQHGGKRVETGVGIIAQSSNIAINLTMQKRGLDIAQLFTIGNQAVIGLADIGQYMLADPRIKAIGLYLEGFGDIRALEKLAKDARSKNIPIVILKTGKTEQSRAAAISHTASLSGSDKVASAFIHRLGFYEVETLAEFLECLKFLQIMGPLYGNRIASVSCSGGEASLMSDLSRHTELVYQGFSNSGLKKLSSLLGDQVELANPLDYHTYIWGDVPVMTDVFATVMAEELDLSLFVLDIPRADHCDPTGHDCAIEAIIAAKARTDGSVAVIGSLPENLEEDVIARFIRGGIVPLLGMQTGLRVVDILSKRPVNDMLPVLLESTNTTSTRTLSEVEAKTRLSKFEINVPKGKLISDGKLPETLSYPLVAKISGVAHKSETGGVVLNIQNVSQAQNAIEKLSQQSRLVLLEEMMNEYFVELIVGAILDPTGIWSLTIGSGGVLTELLSDAQTILLPTNQKDIQDALMSLRVFKLLEGYRGNPKVNIIALIKIIMNIANFVEQNSDEIVELEINPLAIGPTKAMALDALIIEK